jgi:hypothetical protein
MPTDDVGLAILADRKAAEGLAKRDAEQQEQIRAVEARLKAELGLTSDQSLWGYKVGSEPLRNPDPTPQELDDEVAEAIDDLFAKIDRVMADEPWEEHFPSPEVAPVSPPVVKPARRTRAMLAIKKWLPRR